MGWERLFCSFHSVKTFFISDNVDQIISSITWTAKCSEKPAVALECCPWGASGPWDILTSQPACSPVDHLGNPLHLISYSASVWLGTISLLVAYLPSSCLSMTSHSPDEIKEGFPWISTDGSGLSILSGQWCLVDFSYCLGHSLVRKSTVFYNIWSTLTWYQNLVRN